ncbi:hypothetical protein F2Q70_00017613 [Brassica cretica]|uniref:Uncharacterized protein n=1 Tax=Brassica cretica TaxID=69181 RepID=A0A8S9I554_BRACR|nr:hypothetical protein F2Q70_00017613 [Brassica cretica]KAF2595759.1 hypothetical protein F2Q68_00010550 [Brassica cretica]
MGVLVHEEPCGMQGPIRLEPAASRGGCTGCKIKIDRVQWDMVPWPVRIEVHGLDGLRIHMIRVDSLDSDYGNLLVGIYHEFS